MSVVLALLVLLVLSGCSSTPQETTDPTPSPTATGSGRFGDPAELGTALRQAALEAGGARGDLVASSVDGRVDGTVVYEFADDDVEISAEVAVAGPISADLGVVLADGVVYVRVPALYQLFTSAPWVRLPAAAGSDLSEQVDGLVEALAAEVPGAWLLDVDDTATMTFRGTDTVDGVEVEVYDVGAAVDATAVVRTYWVDADDLVRRLDSVARDPAQDTPATSRHTYTDWGEAVSVQAPDPAQVADLPEGLL